MNLSQQPTAHGVNQTAAASALQTNKVLRNTYAMLSMTLLFSGLMAAVSTYINPPAWTGLASFGIGIVMLMFVMPRTLNSSAGIWVTFIFTGVMGFGLGPMLANYLVAFSNGSQLIMTALGGTGVIVLGLSGYALTTRKDFSFMGGFLFVGLMVGIIASIIGMFFSVPGMHLAISVVMLLVFSGYILYDTSRIIHGGETNYLRATISLYLDILNLFVSLLSILGALSGDD